jgi:uncharacterized integral membrane protein
LRHTGAHQSYALAMAERDDKNPVDERRASPQLIAGIVVALAVVDFVVQNRDRITIHFLFFSFDARTWMALLITGVLAIVAAELMGRQLRRRKHKS